jgi:glycosyltransferase involved in cell wall biosynthesis
MIDSNAIRADLGIDVLEGIEFISDYQPNDLPGLLAQCTVGGFPSYVEGFGLAVLEQLAAGIPTVAYDTAGPRDLLAVKLPTLLVPKGDVDAIAKMISRILQSDLSEYEKLSRRCAEAAATFDWQSIAKATLLAYQNALEQNAPGPVFFVQPFSLGAAGGGSRILRALLESAPFVWCSVCTSPQRPKRWPNEFHLQSRPAWGRIEYSRFASVPNLTGRLFAPVFRRRLRKLCIQKRPRAFHVVPHSNLDFAEVHGIARELGLPFFMSLHDDLAYTAAEGGASEGSRESAMRSAWREAAERFVISEALGREYCNRYGTRGYQVVTDGVSELTAFRAGADLGQLRVYFMGLFHMGYEGNLRALLDGLAILKRREPSIRVQVTCRCEHIRPRVFDGSDSVVILPFSSEAQIKEDMKSADLLYMPMPFGPAHEKFARYSLSTKMVTYVGSGVPILYHGPSTSAAFDLLKRNDAAVLMTTLDPEEIADTLLKLTVERRGEIANHALALAKREFMLEDQTRRFWGGICNRVFSGMNAAPEIVITTMLPPLICGVGTYSWLLHKYTPNNERTTHFLVMKGAPESRAALGWKAINNFDGKATILTDALNASGATSLLLHYTGRGYHRLGCPIWLPGVFRNWKATSRGGQLTIFFHEAPGELPMRSRHFWLGKIETRIVRQLATLADVVITNTETHANALRTLSGRNDIAWVPVGSNIDLSESASASPPRTQTEFMIFGLPFGRLQTLRTFWPSVKRWSGDGLLTKLHLVGPEDPKLTLEENALVKDLSGIIIRHGPLGPSDISQLLQQVRFALSNVTRSTWSKSSVFMAYAGQGCAVVIKQRENQTPLCYTIGEDEIGRISASEIELRSDLLKKWYVDNAAWPVIAGRVTKLSQGNWAVC